MPKQSSPRRSGVAYTFRLLSFAAQQTVRRIHQFRGFIVSTPERYTCVVLH